MSRFSIIIPLLKNLSLFEDSLASALRYRCEACQIIVAHAGQYDDPYGLAKEVDFVAADPNANLIQLFNAGTKVARGEFVALLRAGIQLDENWDTAVAASFANPDVGSVAPVIVSPDNPSRLVAAGINHSSAYNRRLVGVNNRVSAKRSAKLKPLGPTSWAAFYRGSLLTAIGEFDEQLDPLYLDLDLALTLQQLDFSCVHTPDCIVTIEDSQAIIAESRQSHGRSAQRAFARHSNLTASQTRTQTTVGILKELATIPWRPANLKHAVQRFGAGRYLESDQHHVSLLSVLSSQRERLVSTSLKLHQSTAPPLGRFATARKAA